MSAARTERLLNLLALLLNTRRPVALREIREMDEFGAYRTADPKSGERAFERDKAALVELGVPLRWVPPELEEDWEGGEGSGGYTIDRDKYYLPELSLGATEWALLSIAGSAAVAIEHFPGRDAIVRALAKLGFDVDESTASPTLAHSPLQPGADSERIGKNLEVLHEAVARRGRVTVHYSGLDGSTTERDVHPWGLYYRQGVWYLVGWCHLRDAERTFHLGRMLSVEPAAKKSKPKSDFDAPADFDLKAKARLRPWEFPSESPTHVTIRLAERLAPALGEIFGDHAQLDSRDGEHLVTLQVTSTSALIAAVLPYGAAAEVIAPPQLRQRIGDIYRELASRYGDGT